MILVTAAIIEKDSKILLAKRKEGKHLAGYWEFPGGKLEGGETAEACLKRELLEEFSIEVNVLSHVADSEHTYTEKTIKLMGYRVEYISGEFILNDHDEIVWVTTSDAFNYRLAPADIPILAAYENIRTNR